MNKRKFDWEEAQKLYWGGAGVRELAERFGVNVSTIRKVCVPGEYENLRQRQQRIDRRSMPCERCGDPLTRKAWLAGARLCVECVNRAKVTTVREDSLRCIRCKRWLPDGEFYRSRGDQFWYRRNRHKLCRSCASELGRERRTAGASAKNV